MMARLFFLPAEIVGGVGWQQRLQTPRKGSSAMSFRLPAARGLLREQVLAALAAATLMVSTTAHAQQPAAPATAPPAEAQQRPAEQQDQLIYTPWTKYCLKTPDDKQTCFIGKDGRIASDKVLIAAVIVERDGNSKNILRVTLPLGMQLVRGTRVIVDNNPPAQSPYVICFANGCTSEYEVTPELIANMKKGQNLVVQAIGPNGAPISLPLPLQETGGGFAKAYDGLPPDTKVIEDNYKKLHEELQARADETPQKPQETQPPRETQPPAAAKTPGPAEK
jgi:invasion protein IalB